MQANGEKTQNMQQGWWSLPTRGLHFDATPVTANSFSQNPEPSLADVEPFAYRSQFQDCMVMNADTDTVSAYLTTHQDWFRRCAHPMQVESIDANAYALVIGKFGAMGYEVEPKIGLNLLPQNEDLFRIATVPVPGDSASGYTVDFQATMRLCEASSVTGSLITQVNWDLDLTVSIRFPRFIYRLPTNVIQVTGDRVLKQIVRQVSRRLTYKVQQDFHTSHGLPMPPKKAKG